MMLTEEQVNHREDLFLDLIEQVADEAYDMNESYEMTEEDAYITSIIMEYFIENYKQPTLKESAFMSLTGTDINEELYVEVIDMLLDESVGTFVAGAVHGLRTVMAHIKSKQASKSSAGTRAAYKARVGKTAIANKALARHKSTSPIGKLKATYLKSKAAETQGKEDKAASRNDAAVDRELKMKQAHTAAKAKKTSLANKIDTGITNAKNKVKSGASRFAHAIARGAGKVAGALS